MAEQGGDAVDEHLAADQADGWVRRGLGGQMLAAAEADLEPDLVDGAGEKGFGVEHRAVDGRHDGQARQQRIDQGAADLPQRPPLAAAVKTRPLMLAAAPGQAKAERRSSTRSSFSHEKPPSASAGGQNARRPRCEHKSDG